MNSTEISLQLLSGMSSELTPVAIEIDQLCVKGGLSLAANPAALKEIRDAIAAGAGYATDTNLVRPVLGSRATDRDVEYFKANPLRTHLLREGIEGENVLAGRTPASNYIVAIVQIRSGVRLLVPVHTDFIKIDPATRPARFDSDDVLTVLFEAMVRVPRGQHIDVDAVIALVDQMRSASASESDSRRRPS